MTLVHREPSSTNWEDLLFALSSEPESLTKRFTRALQALSKAKEEGYITDEEIEILTKEIVASFVAVKLDDVILSNLTPRGGRLRFFGGRYPRPLGPRELRYLNAVSSLK